jgi:hypothetical protein
MSILRSSIFETFSLSSLSIRWIAFFPTTPVTCPPRPSSVTRCPTKTCASQPPIPSKLRYPWLVDVGDDHPDLVDVPTQA